MRGENLQAAGRACDYTASRVASTPPHKDLVASSGGHAAVAVPRIVGRYALYGELARGGMATVHFGRLLGPVGFSRTVAIKRLHPQFAVDPEFVSMFLDEARLAARIRHPNVVSTLDVVALEGELMLVMEYVQGESLSRLVHSLKARNERIPTRIAVSVMSGILSGLHAAHEAKSERGEALGLVHRDMSPQNVLVGVDGVARVLDFGIAKAAGRVQTTRDGQFKGKLAYVAPEQLKGNPVDRRTDVYAATVILWEMLTLQRLFKGDTEYEVMNKVMSNQVTRPSQHVSGLAPGLDEIVMRGLSGDPADRFGTAREMAIALESLVPAASSREVEAWAELVAGDALRRRAQQVEEIETASHHMLVDSGIRDLTGLMANAPNSQRPQQPRTSDPSGPSSAGTPPMSTSLPTNPPAEVTGQNAIPATDRSWNPPPQKRSRVLPVLLFLGLLSGAAAAVFYARKTEPSAPVREQTAAVKPRDPATHDEATTKKPEAEAQPTTTTTTTTTTATEPTVVPSTTATQKVAGPLKLPTTYKGTTTAVPTATTAASAKPSATAPPAPTETAVAAKCNPPYTIDAQGIRHPKPDCL